LGGLARKSAILNEEKNNSSNYIVLDAGDLYFKNNSVNPGKPTELAKISAETIVNSFNEIGCDAFNVGENDFALGLEYLTYLKEMSNFPYISANIKNTAGSYIFNPYKIVIKGGLKFGVIGLSSIFQKDGIIVEDPIESLAKIIEFVNTQSDFVVLLFNASDNDINRFHKSNFPIDIVIQSKSKKRSNDGGNNDIPIYSCGDRGKYIYEFELNYNNIQNNFLDIAVYESTVNLMNRKIRNLSQNNNQPEDEEAQKIKLENYTKQKLVAEEKLNSVGNIIKLNKIELGKKIVDDPIILKIVDSGNMKKNLLNPQPQPSTKNPGHGQPGHRHGE
jgi:2',3'-cyclic-nucleotide 2'-phosphodiesterase (5'-nucleotidase family)